MKTTDNNGKPRSLYIERLQSMADDALGEECESKIRLSAYARNNPRSDYHWQCDATHDECARRGKPEIYTVAHEKISMSTLDAYRYVTTVRRVLIAEGWTLTEPQPLQTYETSRLNTVEFTAEHSGPSRAVRHITYRPEDPANSMAVSPVGGVSDKNLGSLFDGVARLLRAGVIGGRPK